MIIAGAGGFAKEVYEIIHQTGQSKNIAFYIDVQIHNTSSINNVSILNSTDDLQNYFKSHGNKVILGIGNPEKRLIFSEKIEKIGGEIISLISPFAEIGSFGVSIGKGTIIMGGVRISNDVIIGEKGIIYYNTIVTHDCNLGNFVQISPGVVILGGCKIGDYCQIGANATILPKVTLGKNVIVGAGAVVTENQPDNAVVIGIPAKCIKFSRPIKVKL